MTSGMQNARSRRSGRSTCGAGGLDRSRSPVEDVCLSDKAVARDLVAKKLGANDALVAVAEILGKLREITHLYEHSTVSSNTFESLSHDRYDRIGDLFLRSLFRLRIPQPHGFLPRVDEWLGLLYARRCQKSTGYFVSSRLRY